MDDRTMRLALERHWNASDAGDFNVEHDIYREDAVLDYPQSGEQILGRLSRRTRPSGESLMLAYEAALSIYFSGKGSPRGCFVIGTAVAEAVDDAAIRNSVAAGLRMIHADFEAV